MAARKELEAQMGKQPKHGFTEYLKNPDLFRREVQEMHEADAASPPKSRKLDEVVAAMYSRPLEYDELVKLKKASTKAVPLLLDALRNESFLLHRYGPEVLDGSPMETALDVLEPFALPEARILEPALRHADENLRYHALYHLARCANDDAIEAIKAGLTSDSEHCRTGALIGLAFLKDSSRGSAKFRSALFETALPLLNDKEYGPAKHAPNALLALDCCRAQATLLGKVVFRPDNERIDNVLQALKDESVPVSGSHLRDLLAGIKDRATDCPFDYAYADGLVLLARAEGARATDLIADAQTWGDAVVKRGAAEAAELAAGVKNAYEFVCRLYQRKGAEGLSRPQLYYLTLSWLDGEVNNGGFGQYFFNSSGELACHAVAAAGAVGASRAAIIIQKAIALFGEDGPDPDRDRRMNQLSGVDLEALDKLNTEYYRCPDDLRELLPRYVASNSGAFQPKRKASSA